MSDLTSQLETLLAERLSGAGKGLSERALALSDGYRDSLSSQFTIADSRDALAYALTRLPATGAALAAALDQALQRLGSFAPRSVLDAGAGPGTASWHLAGRFDRADFTLVDNNPAFLALAADLAAASGHPALAAAQLEIADLSTPGATLPRADLVVASYALTELPDNALEAAAETLWAATAGVLVIVEPGRPREHTRLMRIRARLLRDQARIVAPCPHDRECPLTGNDWCHFSVRLNRSRAHRQLKGGTLGYEDEKFSYLILARPDIALGPAHPRVIAPPQASKHTVELTVCSTQGRREPVRIEKRSGAAFKTAKRLKWGATAFWG